MRKLIALPTWIVVRIGSRFFPDGHPFKCPIPLEYWHINETELCRQFDLVLWMACAAFVVVAVKLI